MQIQQYYMVLFPQRNKADYYYFTIVSYYIAHHMMVYKLNFSLILDLLCW